jgi:ADP-L-glycero-D-manno-heptose 6-epimerase
MKKVLITGSQGFIGSRLLSHLSKTNEYQIFTLTEDIFNNDTWVDDIKLMLLSIQPDVIFHVGACSDTLEQNVNYMMILNFESTKVLMDFAKENNVPFIYSSSAANYGTNDLYPSNLYGWSKYVAEQYVISNGGIALRYFNVYGPGEEHKGKMASVAFQMYQKHLRGEKVSLFPKKPLRDFVYVKDVVDANIFAHENYDTLKGHYYEVGSGEARGFEDVLKLMDIFFDYVDETLIPNGYQFYTCSNPDKWMKGWFPSWTLEFGIKDYKKYLKNENN